MYIFLWRSKKLQRELISTNIITIPCHTSHTFPSRCGCAVRAIAKWENYWYYRKSVHNFQYVFNPFYSSDIYDSYMDGCGLMSAIYITNPHVIILYMWKGYHSLKTEQFCPILKYLTLWHVEKCISALKFIN